MSGHSKWSKIKRKKGVNDVRRGQLWSKIARRIIMAAKDGGGNLDDNLTLRYAVDEGRAANMPNDTINKAIKKGTGELGPVSYEQILYEGFGSGGVAVMAECLTDNRNRTAPELRRIFEMAGGQLGASGSVAWMFKKKGTFSIDAGATDEDTLMSVVLDAGADDLVSEDGTFEVTCDPAVFADVKQALADAGIPVETAAVSQLADNPIQITDPEHAQKVLRLLENLEEHDDVQHVYANFDIADDVMAKVEQ
ncbi:MAG: YebC/PmpR family DNA-binding transcriptional regulator [Planctomycetes bacterium]|nr:YebC/PmpR family DNA-binding transcriptional regulator [Planctomycetota bacterium]